MAWDVIVKGGMVLDGTGKPAFRADVGVRDGRIADVAPDLPAAGSPSVDASGCVVCPGFIDAHAHGEMEPLVEPSAASKVLGGVTTEVGGNCGFSPFPLVGHARKVLEPEAVETKVERDWTTAAQYFDRVEKAGTAINRAYLVGHGTVRSAAGALKQEAPTKEQAAQMRSFVEQALEEGCVGMSTGLIYPPGCFSTTEELIDLARICGRRQRIYASHMRDEGGKVGEAIEETLRIGRESGARAQISHIKVSGRGNWHMVDRMEEIVHSAKRSGADFNADQYPYIATCTNLDAVLPNWAYEGGVEQEMKRLEDDATARRMGEDIGARVRREEYWSEIRVLCAGEMSAEVVGRTPAQLAASWKVPPFEAVRRVLLRTKCRAVAVYFTLSEDIVRRIMKWDFVMAGSDATARNATGPTARNLCHPRAFGTFPRVLARYVREEKVIALEEAVRKMTSLPAAAFRLKDRGRIENGFWADLVVLDPAKVSDRATFDEPMKFPVGIDHVFVAGRRAVADGKLTGDLPGRVLRA